MNRALLIILLSIVIGLTVLAFLFPTSWQKWAYDLSHDNREVTSLEELEKQLNELNTYTIEQLPSEYVHSSLMADKTFLSLTGQMKFFQIPKRAVSKKIVGHFRWIDFICKDDLYSKASYWRNDFVYCGIDPRILKKVLELQLLLKEQGYDPNAMKVNSGHRTPRENQDIGGASKSRHIAGEAIDLHIGDINQDGVYTDQDKQIVLDLCERKVIVNQGGIGRYPGTRAVHIDVRGHRARWDSY